MDREVSGSPLIFIQQHGPADTSSLEESFTISLQEADPACNRCDGPMRTHNLTRTHAINQNPKRYKNYLLQNDWQNLMH